MVIERKILVWPPDYVRRHNLEHEFSDLFISLVKGAFEEDLYALEVSTKYLCGDKQGVKDMARQIADKVLESVRHVCSSKDISARCPLPWRFGRLPDFLRDESTPDKGVGVYFLGPPDLFEVDSIERSQARDGLSRQLQEVLVQVESKFGAYDDSLRVLILEVYGNNTCLSDSDVEDAICKAALPPCVSQIWLAYPEYIGEWDWRVAYRRVK
ncbi:hypothetical protein E3J62_11110 [candidate division TA06 bacterium]|uniref:Uncharacterized protein n=1 Tax=candidate division TA06 bacterium TaxID=2250710 RepID=A0A523UNQ1_UNCT6|nr:MAG: hypothetical protein E3J62_11110 [candidate division TA06 bacterium]